LEPRNVTLDVVKKGQELGTNAGLPKNTKAFQNKLTGHVCI